MRIKACLSVLAVLVCAVAISNCASRPAARFPDEPIYSSWGIDYNFENAVPIKATIWLEDEPASHKSGDTSMLPFTTVNKIAGFAQSSATGNVITNDGYILTNYHVIDQNPTLIQVMVGAGNTLAVPAKIAAVDENNDLAVIKVNHSFANVAHFGTKEDIRINQTIYYWGYPHGLSRAGIGKCFHRGYVSRLNVHNPFFSKAGLTRFYMGIRGAPGVSGSAIYLPDGHIIGIMQGHVASGLHFVAIPVDQVTDFLSKNRIPYSS